MGEPIVPDDSIQQRMQRLVVSQQQCVDRVAQVDTQLEQFRQTIRQDAFEIALTVQRVMQDLHGQEYDESVQTVLEKTDRNTHEVCSSVSNFKIIDEQADIRNFVELARRMDNAREQTYSEGTTETAAQ